MRHGLPNDRDVHVHQKVVAPFVIERVVTVHEVDDDAGARALCLGGGFDARRIAEAVVGRESPGAQKRSLAMAFARFSASLFGARAARPSMKLTVIPVLPSLRM